MAEDEDKGPVEVLTYTLIRCWTGVNERSVFAIDWATGQLKTKGLLDFEGASVTIDGVTYYGH